jgi:hypothetical protein
VRSVHLGRAFAGEQGGLAGSALRCPCNVEHRIERENATREARRRWRLRRTGVEAACDGQAAEQPFEYRHACAEERIDLRVVGTDSDAVEEEKENAHGPDLVDQPTRGRTGLSPR